MKLAAILVLCLAVSIHQTTAKAFFIDAISGGIRAAGSAAEGIVGTAGSVASGIAGKAGDIASGIAKGASGAAQGAIGAATGIATGVIGVKARITADIADKAASLSEDISENVQNVQNKILKGALQNAQTTLQQIQDNAIGALQASEVAAKNAEEGLIELEEIKNQLIEEWAEKAKAKLANASPETQEKGEDLIDGFVKSRSEAIKQASDKVLQTLENIQEKAHATVEKYNEPMNKLIEQVGKCSQLKLTQVRELIKCGGEIQKDLGPLATAPGDLAAIKEQIMKPAGQSIIKDIRVESALNQFRDQSRQIEFFLDRLVAEDKQNQEQEPEEDDKAVQPEEDKQSDDEPADEEAQE